MTLLDPISSDLLTRTSTTAMDALTARQATLAHNLANAATPNFTASQVSFEDSLADAVSSGTPEAADITTTATSDPANADGNNVNVTNDTLALQQTQVALESAIATFNFRINILSDGLAR